MSSFEKVSQGDVLDYHTTGLQDPTAYGTYAQPPYATHLIYHPALSEDNDQLHYMTSSDLSAQSDPYDENRSSFFDPRIRQLPEITSYTPQDAEEGTRVYVYVRTVHDLLAQPLPSIYLSFGSKRVVCLIEQIPSLNAALKQYALSAEAPTFLETGHHSFSVPLVLVMAGVGGSTSAPQAVEVGAFTYHGHGDASTARDLSRKRKLSSSSDDVLLHPGKRTSVSQLRTHEAGAEYTLSTSATSPYSPFLPTPTGANLYQNRYQQGTPPQSYGHHYSTSTASQSSLKAPSPHTPSYSPSFSAVNKAALSPALAATPARPSDTDANPKAPALVRTSTIQQATAPTISSVQAFNPYSMYPHKATLKLEGNLDVMAEGWTREEWDVRRRLVQFSRRQSGSTISADFVAITPEERQPNSICISCIWWEEKKECFVTSVDTIYLLESLVAVRFTVEEKNRIRRNLEGFRPLTVSKSKPESDDFFKLIMGFPNPKPRNIEKDVKVFPWKILAHALKKIIGKYSASYSSTAAAIPSTPNYSSSRMSQGGTIDARVPRPSQSSSTPSAYSTVMGQMQRYPTSSSQPAVDLRLQVPTPTTAGLTYQPTYSYQQAIMPQPQAPPLPALSAPIGRLGAPIDFAPFGNVTSNIPTTGHTFTYPRATPVTAAAYSMPPVSYPTGYPTSSG